MSKWVNSDKFKKFVNNKKKEKENEPTNVGGGFFLKWTNPIMGTQDTPKIYKIRLLTDKNGDFYKKYYYHFFQSGEKTYYILCEKTHGFDKFCPWCAVNQQLWKGNSADKERAGRYRRNERYVGNAFIIHDPRDSDISDPDKKYSGTRRLYEFPATVENKIANELTNDEEGFGPAIFDPENGHDLLIKISAKKPDKNGKVWPDYSLTEFSRKQSAIADTPEEIEKIMESVYDLTEYIKQMGMSWQEQEKLLKQELVWDEVEDEFIKNFGSKKEVKKETPKQETKPDSDDENESDTKDDSADEESPFVDDDTNDEDLLNELENL